MFCVKPGFHQRLKHKHKQIHKVSGVFNIQYLLLGQKTPINENLMRLSIYVACTYACGACENQLVIDSFSHSPRSLSTSMNHHEKLKLCLMCFQSLTIDKRYPQKTYTKRKLPLSTVFSSDFRIHGMLWLNKRYLVEIKSCLAYS